MHECSGLLLGIRRMLAVADVLHIRLQYIHLLRIRHLRIERPLKDHLNFSGFSIVFRIKYQSMSKCTDRIVAAAERSRNRFDRHHLRFPILLLRSWSSRQHSHHSSNLDYNFRSYTDSDCLLLEPAKGRKFCYFVTIIQSQLHTHWSARGI